MNLIKGTTCITTLMMLCAPAWAINKCIGPDGKVVFQDSACSGKGEKMNVRPATGDGNSFQPAASPAANTTDKQKTEAQRIETQISDSQRKRRRQELEMRLVPDAQGAINNQRAQCDSDLKALQDKKAHANNNLAGATWETSISSEMTAVATRCDTRNREVRDDLDTLRKECQALGGCK